MPRACVRLVANIQWRTLKAEVGEGFRRGVCTVNFTFFLCCCCSLFSIFHHNSQDCSYFAKKKKNAKKKSRVFFPSITLHLLQGRSQNRNLQTSPLATGKKYREGVPHSREPYPGKLGVFIKKKSCSRGFRTASIPSVVQKVLGQH